MIESGQVDWIGIESINRSASNANVDIADNSLNDQQLLPVVLDYLDFQDLINERFSHLPNWDADKTNQLRYLLYSADIIVRANHPEIFRRVKVYPLEDRSIRSETESRYDDETYWLQLFKENVRVTFDQYLQVNSFLTEARKDLHLISENELEAFLNRLGVHRDARVNIGIRMRTSNDIILLNAQRDRAVVQSILELPGNGLILFGTAHGPGIKQGLIEACWNNISIFDRWMRLWPNPS